MRWTIKLVFNAVPGSDEAAAERVNEFETGGERV
jgi:hypothetical protein